MSERATRLGFCCDGEGAGFTMSFMSTIISLRGQSKGWADECSKSD